MGCLHVRPVLNMKQEIDAKKLRAITEETFAIVRNTKVLIPGAWRCFVRSEFHELMYAKEFTI